MGVLALLFLAGTVVFGVMYFAHRSAAGHRIVSTILPPGKLMFASLSSGGGGGHVALSPDGRLLAFVAADSSGQTRLMVRALDSPSARELTGTEGATYPFWSPDSRYIGFFQSGKMKKIESSGGPSVTICDAPDGRGGSWNRGGEIVFSPISIGPIYRVRAAGGTAIAVTKFDTARFEQTHRWPFFLPDGNHFLYFSRSSQGGIEREEDGLYVSALDGKTSTRLMHAQGNVVYASGFLIFVRENTLMAQPFDLRKLRTSGDAMPIPEPVEFDRDYNRADFSVSQNGILVYRQGISEKNIQLEWVDRTGKLLGTILRSEYYWGVSLSPDKETLAFDVYDYNTKNRDIWLYDIARGVQTRFTSDPSIDWNPVWSPDGSRIAFSSDRKENSELLQKATSGAGKEEVLLESPLPVELGAQDWSSDGKFILYSRTEEKTFTDLWILRVGNEKAGEKPKPSVFLQTEFDEAVAQFSPDMRWVGYTSNQSGKYELYVRSFFAENANPPIDQAREWRISANGAIYFKWNRNGKELFYWPGGNKVMAAAINTGASKFEVGAVQELFELKGKKIAAFCDVSADGQRLLIGISAGEESASPLTLVTNWNADLKKK